MVPVECSPSGNVRHCLTRFLGIGFALALCRCSAFAAACPSLGLCAVSSSESTMDASPPKLAHELARDCERRRLASRLSLLLRCRCFGLLLRCRRRGCRPVSSSLDVASSATADVASYATADSVAVRDWGLGALEGAVDCGFETMCTRLGPTGVLVGGHPKPTSDIAAHYAVASLSTPCLRTSNETCNHYSFSYHKPKETSVAPGQTRHGLKPFLTPRCVQQVFTSD